MLKQIKRVFILILLSLLLVQFSSCELLCLTLWAVDSAKENDRIIAYHTNNWDNIISFSSAVGTVHLSNNTDFDLDYLILVELENQKGYQIVWEEHLNASETAEYSLDYPYLIEILNGNIEPKFSGDIHNLKIKINSLNKKRIDPLPINISLEEFSDYLNNNYFVYNHRPEPIIYLYSQIKYSQEKGLELKSKDKYTNESYTITVPSKIYKNYIEQNPLLLKQFVFTEKDCEIALKYINDEWEIISIEGMRSEAELEQHRKLLNKLKTHVEINGHFYPKLSDNETDIQYLDYNHVNFKNNNPYGFNKNCYYFYNSFYNSGEGRILQWLGPDTCLFNFTDISRYDVYWDSLALMYFDSSVNSYPFDSFVCKYIDVYSYQTTGGGYNTIPIFVIIQPEDDL